MTLSDTEISKTREAFYAMLDAIDAGASITDAHSAVVLQFNLGHDQANSLIDKYEAWSES